MCIISNVPDIGKLRRCSLLGLDAQDQPSPLPTENWTAVACELGSKCYSPFRGHSVLWVHSSKICCDNDHYIDTTHIENHLQVVGNKYQPGQTLFSVVCD